MYFKVVTFLLRPTPPGRISQNSNARAAVPVLRVLVLPVRARYLYNTTSSTFFGRLTIPGTKTASGRTLLAVCTDSTLSKYEYY